MANRKFTDADIERCEALADLGKSAPSISEITGISVNTIAYWRSTGRMKKPTKAPKRRKAKTHASYDIRGSSRAGSKSERASGLTSEDSRRGALTEEERRRARGRALRNSPLGLSLEQRARERVPRMVNIKDGEEPDDG